MDASLLVLNFAPLSKGAPPVSRKDLQRCRVTGVFLKECAYSSIASEPHSRLALLDVSNDARVLYLRPFSGLTTALRGFFALLRPLRHLYSAASSPPARYEPGKEDAASQRASSLRRCFKRAGFARYTILNACAQDRSTPPSRGGEISLAWRPYLSRAFPLPLFVPLLGAGVAFSSLKRGSKPASE